MTQIHGKQGHLAQKWRGRGGGFQEKGMPDVLSGWVGHSQAGNSTQENGKAEVRNSMYSSGLWTPKGEARKEAWSRA